MQRIARELGQTETCFVSSSDVPRSISRCAGSRQPSRSTSAVMPPVAAFTVLAGEGRVDWSDDRAHYCATRTGAIGVWLERTPSGSPRVMMSVGVAPLEPATEDRSAVAQAVGLNPSARGLAAPGVGPRQCPPDHSRVATRGFASLGTEWARNDRVRQAAWLPALHACLSRNGKPGQLRPPASLSHPPMASRRIRSRAPRMASPRSTSTGKACCRLASGWN